MTDKEFKRLSRSQLIDIIYQLQLKQEELSADNEKLAAELADKRIRIEKAGNIAEAAIGLHDVMKAAQEAADHYLKEVRLRIDEKHDQLIKAAENEAAAIIEKAKQEAAEILAKANEPNK